MTATKTHASVQDYYGRVLRQKDDLKTNACTCSTAGVPVRISDIIRQLEPEVIERFYGCGSPIPPVIQGCTVLDLGCGTGRDSFICSQLVGERGRVIGVDMTTEQIEVARRHADAHAGRFGYAKPNTQFLQGYMEDLKALGVENETVDAAISNCVINLAPDKKKVFAEIFRVLKPGGELFFSDIFTDRRLPESWKDDQVLLGECLAGAIYVEDFRRMLCELGIRDSRVAASHPVVPGNQEVKAKVGTVGFRSLTIRAFKLDSLEDRYEDYGQVAYYQGTIEGYPHAFALDDHHVFEAGKPMLVCGNTASMLSETRLASHFRVVGDRAKHYGLFPCGSRHFPSEMGKQPPGSSECSTGCC